MSVRTFNYTGRRRIKREHARIIVRGGDDLADKPGGDVGFALDDFRSSYAGRIDADKRRPHLLAARFAIGNSFGKTFKDFPRQQISQGLAIAVGKGGDDHFIGEFGARHEIRGIEGPVERGNLA